MSVTLPTVSESVGRELRDTTPSLDGVSVVSIRRATGAVTAPDPRLVLRAGDTLVLSGLPERLARAEGLLMGGG